MYDQRKGSHHLRPCKKAEYFYCYGEPGAKRRSRSKQKTKKKIADLAEEMGYRSNHFARNLRNQRTNTIGVIVPRLNSYFMSTVIAGIESVANKEGYNLIISQSLESAEKERQGQDMGSNDQSF